MVINHDCRNNVGQKLFVQDILELFVNSNIMMLKFICYRWYHQVSSFGNRTLAINLWFSHLWQFDDDCEKDSSLLLQPLKKFGFASSNEAVRFAHCTYLNNINQYCTSLKIELT